MLNDNQYKAVASGLGPTMVVAGPGSGKTYVIVERIHYMINNLGVHPDNILVITFTKAAANEMKARYQTKYGVDKVVFGTFHSIFYRILKYVNKTKYSLENLIQEDDKRKLITKIYIGLQIDDIEDFVDAFLSELTLMKNQLIELKNYNPIEISKQDFIKVYNEYESYKEMHNKYDFDDMLVDCYYILKEVDEIREYFQKKYKYILIDEFQDINAVQFETILLLKQNDDNIFIVGDDDQSIYCFRGSKPEFLLNLDNYFKNTNKVILDINYRSNPEIIKKSNQLIKVNTKRFNKEMVAHNTGETKPNIIYCKNIREQTKQIVENLIILNKEELSKTAIIYRNNIQARPLVIELLNSNIPFRMKDGVSSLHNHWVTKDILAYLRAADDLTNMNEISRIINKPSRYISKQVIKYMKNSNQPLLNFIQIHQLEEWQEERIINLAVDLKKINTMPLPESIKYIRKNIGYEDYLIDYAKFRRISTDSLFEILNEIGESVKEFTDFVSWENKLTEIENDIKQCKPNNNAVTLTTMHSAKGLEFDTVFIIDVVNEIIPSTKKDSIFKIEEERRLFYVALTRARYNLNIYIPKQRYDKPTEASQFLSEMFPGSIEVGTVIHHKIYKKGVVTKADNKFIVVKFKDDTKKIDYNFCIKQHIIEVIR
ncbi:MAG: hypothetical protein BEN19_08830 [Epulopiscium sp. Nuni2H_MBin003]|nr:MAG: hypothetical protein BEN19_08830 [Epulopiscium sp. Nuni2H_MBin003]